MTNRIIGPDNLAHEGAETLIRGSCVAVGGAAVLVCGASGSGKSALALQLMAHGAALVADDATVLRRRCGALVACSPDNIRGRIEARGVGILRAPASGGALVRLAINMDMVETRRLPPHRGCRILGVDLPLLHKVESAHFPAAVWHYLKGGRSD